MYTRSAMSLMIVFLCFVIWGSGHTACHTTSHMSHIKTILLKLRNQHPHEQQLIVWDIDQVLMEPNAPYIHPPILKRYQKPLRTMLAPLSSEQEDVAFALSVLDNPAIAVEPGTTHLIQSMQGQPRTTMMALTASLSGQINQTQIEKWRYNVLQRMGIDFSNEFNFKTIVFDDLAQYRGHHPTYYHGILSTNAPTKRHKGRILMSFLEHAKQHGHTSPDRIVMIDDSNGNLDDIAATFKDKAHVTTICYQGSAAKAIPPMSLQDFKRAWHHLIQKAKSLVLTPG